MSHAADIATSEGGRRQRIENNGSDDNATRAGRRLSLDPESEARPGNQIISRRRSANADLSGYDREQEACDELEEDEDADADFAGSSNDLGEVDDEIEEEGSDENDDEDKDFRDGDLEQRGRTDDENLDPPQLGQEDEEDDEEDGSSGDDDVLEIRTPASAILARTQSEHRRVGHADGHSGQLGADLAEFSAPVSVDTRTVQQTANASRCEPDGSIRMGMEEMDYPHNPLSTTGRSSTLKSEVMDAVRLCGIKVEEVVKSSLEGVVTDLRLYADSIAKMKEDVAEITSMVAALSTMTFNKQNSGTKKYQMEVGKMLCTLHAYFDVKLLCAVISKCYICHCVTLHQEMGDNLQLGSLLFGLILFSVQPSDRKRENFESVVGKKFSVFRHGILLSSVLALQRNSFGTFLTDREALIADTMRVNNKAPRDGGNDDDFLSRKFKHPRWLQTGYITMAHCDEAAAKAENRPVQEFTARRTDAESNHTSMSTAVSDETGNKGGPA